jgi:O-antigen/teichoic acid export membrane protein
VSSPLLRRIVASTGANLYGQATSIGIQLLSLPLFLSYWGLETYGHWLVLSAIPAYFSMADVGMVSATGNRMTMLVGQGAQERATRAFQGAVAFTSVVCAAVAVVAMAVIALMPQSLQPSSDSRLALAALILGVLLSLFGGLPEAVFRATHRYAFAMFAANTARLLEFAGGFVGLWLYGSFLSVAVGMLLPRIAATVWMVLHARRTSPEFEWGTRHATMADIKESAAPAVAFMAFPAGNAIAFQGVTMVVAATLGPAATAVFNTYRTLSRVTVQGTAVFGNALWTEFSRMYGTGDMSRLSVIYKRSWLTGIGVSVLASGAVYVLAPYMLQVWSKGKIEFMPELMLVAMAYAAVAGFWHVSRTLLLATNRHSRLAWQYLAVSAATLPAAWWLGGSFGLIGAMASMLVAELVLMTLCTAASFRLLGKPLAIAQVAA